MHNCLARNCLLIKFMIIGKLYILRPIHTSTQQAARGTQHAARSTEHGSFQFILPRRAVATIGAWGGAIAPPPPIFIAPHQTFGKLKFTIENFNSLMFIN